MEWLRMAPVQGTLPGHGRSCCILAPQLRENGDYTVGGRGGDADDDLAQLEFLVGALPNKQLRQLTVPLTLR